MLAKILAAPVAAMTNWLLTRLRNGQPIQFSREELRALNFGFGQYGEDLAVQRWARILEIEDGLYVDACAYDPIHTSNTLLLYKAGWRGVNIDMNAERIAKFEKARPDDHNTAAALSDSEGQATMLSFPIGATDRLTTNGESKQSYASEKPIREEKVKTTTLNAVLEGCPFEVSRIDYLNIDAEGHDLQILCGLDLKQYRPAIITIEAWESEDEIIDYLSQNEYALREKLYLTLLFVDSNLDANG